MRLIEVSPVLASLNANPEDDDEEGAVPTGVCLLYQLGLGDAVLECKAQRRQ